MSLLKDCLTKNVLLWNVFLLFYFYALIVRVNNLVCDLTTLTEKPQKNVIKYFIIFVHSSFFVHIIFKYENNATFPFTVSTELYNNVML